jgi:PII-like signaling protein
MKAVALRFYVHHTRRHLGMMLFEWILEQAKAMGIHGGSAFGATAGYGRHGVIHEQRFVEIPADLPIMIEFIVSDDEADALIEFLRRNDIQTFCTRTRTELIFINGDEPPESGKV